MVGNAAKDIAQISFGVRPWSFAVSISVYTAAARSPPASLPAKIQFFLPRAKGRIARSAALFEISRRPSSRYLVNACHRDRA
jgi:hypothetical protein